MELVTPDIGLLFWMLLTFCIVLIVLRKFAWKPILSALKDREEGIQTALNSAEEARKEIAETNTKVDQMLKDGKLERDKLLKSAKSEAAEYRQAQQVKIDEQMQLQLNTAKEEIAQQKRAAVGELKNMVAELSIEIAEKILKKELENGDQHTSLIKESVENLEVK